MNHDSPIAHDLQGALKGWLDEKEHRSGSQKTLSAYRDTFASFLAVLGNACIDYDDEEMIGAIANVIQSWAGKSRKGGVAASTFNVRVSIVSSFYEYARRHGYLSIGNPAMRVSRRRNEATHYAEPRAAEELRARLDAIDRSNLIGMRDYAILVVGLATGRRVGELAGLAHGDVQVFGESTILHFRNMKGGKTHRDKLSARVALPLHAYLDAARKALLDEGHLYTPETPIWLGFSPRDRSHDRYGVAGRYAIAGVCKRWLYTSQTHTLRHSFALMMKNAGATVFEIQASLGHESAATTDLYLRQRIQQPDNPHAESLADVLGL